MAGELTKNTIPVFCKKDSLKSENIYMEEFDYL